MWEPVESRQLHASEPDAWRIAVNEARGRDWYTYDGTLTDLLTALLSGDLLCRLFV